MRLAILPVLTLPARPLIVICIPGQECVLKGMLAGAVR